MRSLVGTLQSGDLFYLSSFSVTNQQGIIKTFIHSVIHSSILSGSQSVSQLVNKSMREACAVGSDV